MVTCESNLKESKGISHVGIWGKMMSGGGNSLCKGPEVGSTSGVLEEQQGS